MAIKVGQNGFLTIDKLNGVSCRIVAISKRTSELTVMTTQCVGAQPSGIRYIVKPYEFTTEKPQTVFITYIGQATRQTTLMSAQAELAAIQARTLLGRYNNNWRQRRVEVYSHPSDDSRVISIGYGIGEALGNIYVCEESIDGYRSRIDANNWTDYN